MFGPGASIERVQAMVQAQRHRGPDARDVRSVAPQVVFGHSRLSILDLSDAGRQPMASSSGRFVIVFNGEVYNYLELRLELADYPYSTRTDTEVVLAAYERWGDACVEKLIGMFAFVIWDAREERLFAARDRFGVKPLHLHTSTDGSVIVASEIRALHAAGVPAKPDETAWSSYLTHGVLEATPRTFWEGISSLPAGHALAVDAGGQRTWRWYDLPSRIGDEDDSRPIETVREECRSLLEESVSLRFRSDVPVGITISGGLDSSLLLGVVRRVQGAENDVVAFTFVTGDPKYDELPWVERALKYTRHPLVICRLDPREVPQLAFSMYQAQGGPFGGIPTLAYARIFQIARGRGVTVLLDGQGMDEQWAGYDYYRSNLHTPVPLVQGATDPALRPEVLVPEFREYAEIPAVPEPFSDRLRNLQYRDLFYTKLPRALRFNDRLSMRSSTELREPFLDHRLVELAMRQATDRKIQNGTGKWFLRSLAAELLPGKLVESPKRAVQTPQREWLRGPLRGWATDCIEDALSVYGGQWLDPAAVRHAWDDYCQGRVDNSFFVWQWLSLGMQVAAPVPRSGVLQ